MLTLLATGAVLLAAASLLFAWLRTRRLRSDLEELRSELKSARGSWMVGQREAYRDAEEKMAQHLEERLPEMVDERFEGLAERVARKKLELAQKQEIQRLFEQQFGQQG